MKQISEFVALRIAFVVLVLIKIMVVAVYGPLEQPDTSGYTTYADHMLRGSAWFHSQPGGGGDVSYRMIGYPVVILIMKILFAEVWDWAVIVFQSALGLVAACFVYRLMRDLLPDNAWRWALFGAAGYATAQAMIFDTTILTDGIYASLYVIASSILVRAARQKTTHWVPIYLAGLLLGLAFLFREATLVASLAFVPLGLLAVRGVAGRWRWCHPPVGLYAPMIALAALHMVWNEYRSGAAFITTGARTGILQPLFKMAGRGAPIFNGDSSLDVNARAVFTDYSYADVLNLNRAMVPGQVTAIELARLVQARYLETMRRHPGSVVAYALSDLRLDRRAVALINPARSVVHLEEFKASASLGGVTSRMRRAKAERSPVLLFCGFIELTFTAIAATLAILAFLVFPVRFALRLVRRVAIPDLWMILAAGWLLYFGFTWFYAMIRIEDRYLIGVTPMALIIGLAMARDLWLRVAAPGEVRLPN